MFFSPIACLDGSHRLGTGTPLSEQYSKAVDMEALCAISRGSARFDNLSASLGYRCMYRDLK